MNVKCLPLEDLPTPFGVAERKRELSSTDIQSLLRTGRVRFVVADVGHHLQWIDESECFDFWKDEAMHHVADDHKNYLSDFPGEYFYFASEWSDNGTPIILLSKYH